MTSRVTVRVTSKVMTEVMMMMMIIIIKDRFLSLLKSVVVLTAGTSVDSTVLPHGTTSVWSREQIEVF